MIFFVNIILLIMEKLILIFTLFQLYIFLDMINFVLLKNGLKNYTITILQQKSVLCNLQKINTFYELFLLKKNEKLLIG